MLNYFSDDARTTPVNLGVARMLLAGAMLWKLLRYDWGALHTWPAPLVDVLPIFRRPPVFNHLEWVAFVCALLLLCVFFGYRLRVTGWASGVLLTYLGTVRHAYNISHTSGILLNAALVLVLFAVFAEEDALSIDEFRRSRGTPRDVLEDHLTAGHGQFRHRALKWALVVVGFFYFQGGYSKLTGDPVGWVQPRNLGRVIAFRVDGPTYYLADLLLEHPTLLFAGAVTTILLETGFLPWIVAGRRLWVFLLGLVGMHTAIAFSVGPIFTDQLVFLALFLPWDELFGRLQLDDELAVVYDRDSPSCLRSLRLFTFLDVAGSVSYYGTDAPPEQWDRDGGGSDYAVSAFRGDTAYHGYDAIRQLFRQFGVLRPVAVLMTVPGLNDLGRFLYRRVDRSRSSSTTT